MASETHFSDSLFEDDAFAASQSLEEELLGKGYRSETPLVSSLAAELQSATHGPPPTSKLAALAVDRQSKDSSQMELQKLLVGDTITKIDLDTDVAVGKFPRGVPFSFVDETFSDQTSPVLSPLQWSSTSTSLYGRSRRSSFSSTWSSLDAEDDDPFEKLKRQLEDLNSAVWETKTLHKRMFNTLLADDVLHWPSTSPKSTASTNFAPPLELIITSVVSLVEGKSRDRERQTSYLRNVDSSIRKECAWMSVEELKELEGLFAAMKSTLYDQTYMYQNPLPALRTLNMETSAVTDSLEELKELMYVNKHQVQELNSRLRSIAKTVHEVRKDIRRINKLLEEKDDDDAVVLEKGEVQTRVKEIMWGLDDLDESSTKKIQQMQLFWEEQKVHPVA
ncbi:hypothetical protein DFQ28_004116 [Apophysomyces sp. BC1034]|nr:hypothetical protein DFQ30_003204 [Apophysomyces sp. BC1015]KAG0179436.1 hypothetical protein DFQ29_002088 [Apophysomyces sp. BC1021]KAG0188965.1 hypothetical protein DFQ28_004116 [Apophysomyces sp. BC1034]